MGWGAWGEPGCVKHGGRAAHFAKAYIQLNSSPQVLKGGALSIHCYLHPTSYTNHRPPCPLWSLLLPGFNLNLGYLTKIIAHDAHPPFVMADAPHAQTT